MTDPTLPRPVTPDEARRDRESARLARKWSAPRSTLADILLGAVATVAALSILALAWEALSAGLPYTSTTLVTIVVAAVVVVGRGA